ncbi:hypothetical protein CXG81DRAFT_27613 [Caulochytrium protostelioides]|uniref:DHHA2 domain-containing protein n=1 Tax=Caulochytrium protostelioides TaxID=1555241 RepID=A0A4P9X3L8_9FUNG|nr:hypothetical protein CXG81DRAFT_27613 [Caulochytrium protostelioides]|eukprot:RKO99633.1 hypothetical protein CXG81DRAFT_27613 [Caulochytrium protostelioides]
MTAAASYSAREAARHARAFLHAARTRLARDGVLRPHAMPATPPPPAAAAAAAGAASPAGPPCTLVLGNESADLDSIVASLAYAALLDPGFAGAGEDADTGTAAPDAPSAVPVVLVPRSEFRLRTHVAWAFARVFGSADAADAVVTPLLFTDDIDWARMPPHYRIVLVDHNRLGLSWQTLSPRVIGILDHHQDLGCHRDAPLRRITTACGSCSSLVAAEWSSGSGSGSGVPSRPPPWLAELLLCAILEDSSCLRPQYERTFPVDVDAARFLWRCRSHAIAASATDTSEPAATADGNNSNSNNDDDARQTWFSTVWKALQAAKYNLRGLSLPELMAKDAKVWEVHGVRYGISSITWHLQGAQGLLAAHGGWPALVAMLHPWMRDRGLDLALIMTAQTLPAARDGHAVEDGDDGVFCRELVLATWPGPSPASPVGQPPLLPPPHDHTSLVAAFNAGGDALQLTPFWNNDAQDGARPCCVYAYNQANTRCSRKQVEPYLRAQIEANTAPTG